MTDPRKPTPVTVDPHTLTDWVFDLDNTLYPAECDLFAQIDQRMGAFIGDLFDVGPVEAKTIQKQYFHTHGTTLRGLMVEQNMAPEAFLDYVHEIDLEVLPPDPALDALLDRIPGRKFIFTNGSVPHAERVTERLGVRQHFEGIFDIVASDYLPKPDPLPYARMVEHFGIAPNSAIMIEDIPRNLAPAAAMGMTTVLVPGRNQWQRDGMDAAHIDFVADDLVAWLTGLLAT